MTIVTFSFAPRITLKNKWRRSATATIGALTGASLTEPPSEREARTRNTTGRVGLARVPDRSPI